MYNYYVTYVYLPDDDKTYIARPMGTCTVSRDKKICDNVDVLMVADEIREYNKFKEVHVISFCKYERED